MKPVKNTLDAEAYRQHSPCDDCPFLKEGGVRHGAERARDYASYFCLQPARTFPCHKSVPKDDDRTQYSAWRAGQTLCAGGLMFAEKVHCTNDIARYGAAKGWYDPSKFIGMDLVFDSLADMLKAHEDEQE